MALTEYVKKRNFKKTPEPASGSPDQSAKLRFVVQRHHASHLHYDFRLEMEGVLKSWAVPKGPSLNPKDKRLAMMVEDHPYNYRTFEGTIPEGNYGAGVVTIFDEGTYESLEGEDDEKELKKGLYSGNLKFRLNGKILKGEFALVKIKDSDDNSWLLIKHRDEYAVDKKFNSEDLVPEAVKKKGIERKKRSKILKEAPEINLSEDTTPETESLPLPDAPSVMADEESFTAMLAKLAPVSSLTNNENWIYERKLDGYRALAFTGKKVKLVSRNHIDFSAKYKPVVKALQQISIEAIIDGEIVAEDKKGNSIFQDLQNYASTGNKVSLKYYAFDLLALDGHDLRGMELVRRKELLKALINNLASPEIIYNEHVVKSGKELLEEASRNNWEGIIAKDGNSTYQSGKRSDSWLKFKRVNSQEAVIIGFSKPEGSRKYFGSLVLGMYRNNNLVYVGNCGTGFDEKTLKEVYNQLTDLTGVKKPVKEKVHRERDVTWVKPMLVCEVTFTEWTDDGHLRHPVFKGLRPDKSPEEVKPEIPDESPDSRDDVTENVDLKTPNIPERHDGDNNDKASSGKHPTPSKKQPVETRKNITGEQPEELEESFGKKTLKLTNLNKLYWKKEKITKGELLAYYREVSDYLLPYLKDRPLSLNRHPNGIDAPGFFQKDLDTEQIPLWIKYATMYSESNDKDIDYLICNDLPTLLWMTNLGCIEINPWLSTYKKPENPIFAVMDLDPNDVKDFRQVIQVALTTREVLQQMNITPFIKTSGSRGLHIFIHTGGKYDYEIVKNFVHYLGQIIHEQHPDTTSLERSPSKRKGKIYLDFLQNRRGQTIAAPYSARPKPGATVSTPLLWEEVNDDLDVKAFTIFNTIERIRLKGDLWKDITAEKMDLKAALERLK